VWNGLFIVEIVASPACTGTVGRSQAGRLRQRTDARHARPGLRQHFRRREVRVDQAGDGGTGPEDGRGLDATELSPAQITAKLEADPVLWNAKIEALRNVGLEVMEIVKNKKVDELWDAGDNLDRACESCHIQYWYPGDTAVRQKLDRRIQERFEQSEREKARAGR
jgi:hypothetical protein